MPVIAMTQEMGSLAKDVAVQLAQSLKLDVMRNEVVEHVAEKMDMHKSAIRRLREGKAGFMERLTTDKTSLALYSAEQVFELANRGNVVLRGWGATCLLRPVPHVPCIRITRSFKKRVEWVMANLETDDAEFAEDEIRRSDEAHASRMHHQFGVTWGDPLLYDLVLNTDRLSVENCVEQIRHLASRPEFQETDASRAVLADMTLEARIRSALKDNDATHGTHITIASRNGHVALHGIVVSAEERAATERVAESVTGVTSVDNQLRVMARSNRFTSEKYL
jgi:cytidylate kinase